MEADKRVAYPGNSTQEMTDNNSMHAKPDLRVVMKWMIYRSGSVIADVIPLKQFYVFRSVHCF